MKTIAYNIIFCVIICLNTFAQNSTQNPWGMTQQQYELYENTSISALNAAAGVHPTYGALPLPDVSYLTNNFDNGSSPTIAQFRFLGAPSHYLKDDPIVFPGQPGVSHLHMFFGNTQADAYSEVGTGNTNDLLIIGASTVQGGKGANPSSYWIPALVDGPLDGCNNQRKIILPDAITVYYKTRRPSESQMIPEGLEVIGGNLPQSQGGMVHDMTIQNSSGGSFREGARWGFYDPNQGLLVEGLATIPQSNPNGYTKLRAVIGFPQCFASEVDGGFKLSSPNNLSHQLMLEDAQGWSRDDEPCPGSHPNRIAKVELLIDFRWPNDNDVSGWRLSSDMGADTDVQVLNPGGSLHGDILFAWNSKVQQAWKDECHDPNDPRNCSIGQTGTQWVLDRIEDTETISNMIYTGNPYLTDPYDECEQSCPPAGTPCDDNDSYTTNDIEDGNCNCASSLSENSCEQVKNGNFTNGLEDWNLQNCTASNSITGIDVNVPYVAQNPWDIVIRQDGFSYEQGREYQISFKAKADANRIIRVKAGKASSPFITYNYEIISITTSLQTHTFTFSMNSTNDINALFEFFLGDSDVNLSLDDISLFEIGCITACPNELNFDDFIPNGTHRANSAIYTNASLNNGDDIELKAGNRVRLSADFSSGNAHSFKVKNESCE